MSDKDTRYNGWTNYETWAVKLWIDNEKGSYNYWREATREAWESTRDKSPNEFMNHKDNARWELAEQLKDQFSDEDNAVFEAAHGTVYADLLNAALSEVNWREIAESLIDDTELTEPAADEEGGTE